MTMKITAYRMNYGNGDGPEWFGGVFDGTVPVADSAQDGAAGAFQTRREALEWARNAKRAILESRPHDRPED